MVVFSEMFHKFFFQYHFLRLRVVNRVMEDFPGFPEDFPDSVLFSKLKLEFCFTIEPLRVLTVNKQCSLKNEVTYYIKKSFVGNCHYIICNFSNKGFFPVKFVY